MRDPIQQLRESAIEDPVRMAMQMAAEFIAVVTQASHDRVKRALEVVIPAYVAGSIYNTEYRGAKEDLDREGSFMWYLGNPTNLYEVLSTKKKLDALKPTTVISTHDGMKLSTVDPKYVQVARELADAAYPLALLMKDLKSKIVKGKKPNPEAVAKRAAQLAAKDTKTCACCFRSIARLKNGLIADHGYTLPTQWAKTASCPGRDFKPLEVSNDGLKFMVDLLKKRTVALSTRIAGAGKWKTITRENWSGKPETISPDHPDWDREFKALKESLGRELQSTKKSLATYSDKLKKWEPVPEV